MRVEGGPAKPVVIVNNEAAVETLLNLLLYGKTGDDTVQPAVLDAYTHALTMMDYPHHEVHAGNHFFYTEKGA